MSADPLYLRQDVQVEPLVDQWYAWPHLIPPATTARNLTHRHFRIMDSYVSAPQVHASAARNPRLLGGPFIDYAGGRVDEIKALREGTAAARAPLLALSTALEQLGELLATKADGYSLHPLYAQVPEVLRGYVELVYDTKNVPSFRLLESLLYRSRYYDRSAQSFIMSITSGDDRPFMLSTPRLASSDTMHVRWSFDDERVDQFFQLKTTPRPWPWIRDRLGIADGDQECFRAFLTTEPPRPYVPYAGSGVRWRYFGHACVLLETPFVTILFDPVLSYTYESTISRYTYNDLPDHIDYVVITHCHQDHILLETLLQIRHKVGQIVVPRAASGLLQDPSVKLMFEHAGFRRVMELGDFETIEVPGGVITGIPFLGEHSDLFVTAKLAYLVRLGSEQLLFAADSCNVEPRMYEHVHAVCGDVGTLFLGMECDGAPLSWLYGPLLLRPIERAMDQSRRLSGSDFAQALDLVNRFGCREVYVYAMGQEPWLNHVMKIKYTYQSRPIVESNRLIRECAGRGIVAERLFGEKEILIDRIYGSTHVAAV